MADTTLTFTPKGAKGMSCLLTTPNGWELTVTGDLTEREPSFSGATQLTSNKVLTSNVWAFACCEKEARVTRQEERRKHFKKQAKLHAGLARNIAGLIERMGSETRKAWCSACFEATTHTKVEGRFEVPTFICGGCGAATFNCAAGTCPHMAIRAFGAIRIPRFCAEHRHDIPSFWRGRDPLDDLSEVDEFLKPDRVNLAKVAKVGVSALVLAGAMTGVGLAAAPLVGGAVGTLVGGYSGAAATSYGLALLGGGSIAAGGFGMAGGTAVIAAVGGALGSYMGASVTNAYVREDDSFRIEKLRDGEGIPVIVSSGFLTETEDGWGGWERLVTDRYPDSPVYRVHWGAQELKNLTFALGKGGGVAVVGRFLKEAAKHASKKAAKAASPLTGGLIVVDLVRNPWFQARQRANKTGAVLADLLARTRSPEYVLIGHSLGARVMVNAAEALGTSDSAPQIREMHLLGAAVGAKGDWGALSRATHGRVYNYHSRDDRVLKFLYAVVQAGQTAAGLHGLKTAMKNIRNVNVTKQVGTDHSKYTSAVTLKDPTL